MRTCGLCPTTKDDNSTLSFGNLDITINDKTIKLGDGLPVNYTWNNDLNSITFQYKINEESFRVLLSAANNTLLWKDPKSVCIIILQKK